MKPRITVITIGVDDLETSLRFYRDGLGLPTEGIVGQEFEHGAVVFIDLQSGVRLALWPRRSMAHDTGLDATTRSPIEFTLGYNVASKAEVDAVLDQAAKAGATIIKAAHDTFWGGYAGYFKTPKGISGRSSGTHDGFPPNPEGRYTCVRQGPPWDTVELRFEDECLVATELCACQK